MVEMCGWLCPMYKELNVFAVHGSAGKSVQPMLKRCSWAFLSVGQIRVCYALRIAGLSLLSVSTQSDTLMLGSCQLVLLVFI